MLNHEGSARLHAWRSFIGCRPVSGALGIEQSNSLEIRRYACIGDAGM